MRLKIAEFSNIKKEGKSKEWSEERKKEGRKLSYCTVHIICRMLEIIDSYEAKIDYLNEELELLK